MQGETDMQRRAVAVQNRMAIGSLITMVFGLVAAVSVLLLLTHWIFGWPPG
jgi:hypothetical protein